MRILKETGCQAVKVESGPTVPETIAYLVQRGVPVIGHVGLRPQAVNVDGAFRAKGRSQAERDAGAGRGQGDRRRPARSASWSRASPRRWRGEITEAVPVPTIGIGASAGCDGQILVTDDMLGLFDWTPKFVRRYADLKGEIAQRRARLRRRRARPPLPGRRRDLLRPRRRLIRRRQCRQTWRTSTVERAAAGQVLASSMASSREAQSTTK